MKPNRAEAEELLLMSIGDEPSIVAAAQRILRLGAHTAVLSLGADGALTASTTGMWRARPPAVAARSTVGAGDAMVAGLAYGLMQSLSPLEGIRLATAVSCAAAAASEPAGTEEQIAAFLPRVSTTAVPMSLVSNSAPTVEP